VLRQNLYCCTFRLSKWPSAYVYLHVCFKWVDQNRAEDYLHTSWLQIHVLNFKIMSRLQLGTSLYICTYKHYLVIAGSTLNWYLVMLGYICTQSWLTWCISLRSRLGNTLACRYLHFVVLKSVVWAQVLPKQTRLQPCAQPRGKCSHLSLPLGVNRGTCL
jgi:hypothetical protein